MARKTGRIEFKALTLIFGNLLVLQVESSSSTYPSKVSLGVYKEELSPPIFYQTFVPLIYEYTVPSYTTLDVTLRDWREKCKDDNFAPSYTCPVFYHFERYLERFEQEVVPKAWVGLANQSISKPSGLRQDNDLCNKIQRNFLGSLTTEYGLEEYIEKLRQCPISELRITRAIGDYIFNIKTLFKKMNDNYENEFANKLFGETNKKIGPAFYVNSVTAHQNGMLLALWVEKTRWTQAQLACNDQRIPKFLLKPQNITNTVRDLKGKLGIGGHITSIPLEEISIYYKLPLADCSYIEQKGNFIVQVSIPVIKKEMKPKLYKFQTVPFIYVEGGNNHTLNSTNSKDKIWCQMKPIQGRFIFDETTGLVYKTDCQEEKDPLCQIKEYQDISTDLCVKSILTNSTHGVRNHCNFDCVPMNETFGAISLPGLQRVSSDTWVFTGDFSSGSGSQQLGTLSESQALIKCPGRKSDEILKLPSYGALEVQLPCDCRLQFKSEIFFTQSPCKVGVDLNPVIRQIVPVHFYKEETLTVVENEKEIKDLPIGDNFLPESAQRLEGSDQKVFIAGGTMTPINDVTNKSSSRDGGGANLGALWTLVILQLIVITTLIALGVYKYVKQRREMTYSKERLVYNVYPTESNPSLSDSISRVDNMNHF